MKAREIAVEFEKIAPRESGVPGDELGFVYGNPDREVERLGCVWQVQSTSIELAEERGIEMLICHESLWLPEQRSDWYDPPQGNIYVNENRKRLLDRSGIVVYRSHSNWDALRGDGVPDQAVKALGIENLTVEAEQRFFRIHRLPQAMSIQELGNCAEQGLGFPYCRIFGDPDRVIERFAFLIGGFGENQWHMVQSAHEMGAEAAILGEMSEFIVISCLEMGMPVIETLHSVSEIPAIRRQAELLAEALPDLSVQYLPSGATAFGKTTG